MTEEEWLACADPRPMLEFVQDKASDRKLRLFACACCRRIWSLQPHDDCRRAVEIAEQYADGLATAEELDDAWDAAAEVEDQILSYVSEDDSVAAGNAAVAALQPSVSPIHTPLRRFEVSDAQLAADSAAGAAGDAVAVPVNTAAGGRCLYESEEALRLYQEHSAAEYASQAILLRCIFGNPFRPVAVDHSWLNWNDETVRRIAEGIYQERRLPEGTLDSGRLAILSDALLDAGCDNEELIAHCRSPGPHVRGCWAIDLLTGRE